MDFGRSEVAIIYPVIDIHLSSERTHWVPKPQAGSHFAGHMEIQAVAHSHRAGLSILKRHEMLRKTMEVPLKMS